jgi:hypothetical protein
MALVDRSGNPVRSGNGNAIGTRTGSGNNNNNNNNGGGGGQAAAQAAAVAQATANRNMQAQIAAAEAAQAKAAQMAAVQAAQQTAASNAASEAAYNQKLQEQKRSESLFGLSWGGNNPISPQTQITAATETGPMYGGPQGNPNVTGNTYANAPTQFTNVRGGSAFYPDAAPDTMFRGASNGLTGGLTNLALDKLGDVIGTDSYLGGMLGAYNEFDPLGDFAQQTMYGMNDQARQEYLRQESTNPDWQMMSEADRVSLARKPQLDNQLPNAYIGGGQGRPNEAQLNSMRPSNISESQWAGLPVQMKSQIAQSSGMMGSMGGGGGSNNNVTGGYSSGSGTAGGSSVAGNNGQYFDGGYTGSAVNQLSQARSPRGMEFGNIYGRTKFNPLTGQFSEETAPEYAQFQQGLLGQLQGSQEAYQSFDPNDAASEYLRGVNAIREPMREQQTDSALSRLIQSGKLGSTVGTQALAQLETEQENQRFQEGVQAQRYGEAAQDRMLRNQAGLFGLSSQVAAEQFKPQQQALGSVPMLQQIYGFAQEPQFQQSLAEQGISAQASANNTANWMNLGTSVLGTDVGQDLISDAWGWLTS